MAEIGIGIDLGSSSVRVSIYNYKDDTLLQTCSKPITYYENKCELEQHWQYAQSSNEILENIDQCFDILKIGNYKVSSMGVASTCSMVVLKADNRTPCQLFPNPQSQHPLDIFFWMDGKSSTESSSLNTEVLTDYEKRCLGGVGCIPEMGIPKLCRLLNYEKEDLVVYDLHKFLAYRICQKNHWDYSCLLNSENNNSVGHDGEISGWRQSLYSDLSFKTNISFKIGPLADEKQTLQSSKIKVASYIDCYTGWIATIPRPDSSITMVAGTSTCYLHASTKPDFHIDGIWGPFTNVFGKDDDIKVYQGGSSLTGKLIEHVLLNHPYTLKLGISNLEEVISIVETYIEDYEKSSETLFQNICRKTFMYGDLEGNRTPYSDFNLRGAFIGETLDVSIHDLAIKYVVTLEFLAFQTKMIVSRFPKIDQLYIVGSQSKNTRLLSLIQCIFADVTIYVAKNIESTEYIGPKGAYLGSKYGRNVTDLKNVDAFVRPNLLNEYISRPTKKKCQELLDKKYEVILDMIKCQQKYNKLMDQMCLI